MDNGTDFRLYDWQTDGKDKPQLNTWYRCKNRDDWYKIVKEGRYNGDTIYRVVSYRRGRDMFYGLTLAQARSAIKIECYKGEYK